MTERFEQSYAVVPRSTGVARWSRADEVDEVRGWVGAGLLDGTVDLVVERGAQPFESFRDRVVCRGVLVDEGEPLYEMIVMHASPGQVGFGVCVCETSVPRR
jgi:hypothetical protein